MSTTQQPRLVDSKTGVRTRPMRVLALGQARTGTSSLRDALVMCGYKPFHFSTMMMNWETQIPLWTEAVQNKYTEGTKPYGREEFDKMVGDFDTIEDNPGIIFAEELIKAYPEAKVILTNRDVDAWAKSMQKTIFKNKHNPIFKYLAYFFPFAGTWSKIMNLIIDNEYAGGSDLEKVKQTYRDHYAKVRELVPKENLLELHFGDGWEPVCKFLDIPQPDIPWPKSNEGTKFNDRQTYFGFRIALTIGVFASLIGVAGWQLPQAYSKYPAFRSGSQYLMISLIGGIFWPVLGGALNKVRKNYLLTSMKEYAYA